MKRVDVIAGIILENVTSMGVVRLAEKIDDAIRQGTVDDATDAATRAYDKGYDDGYNDASLNR
jgi:hypothetical protein